MVFLNSFNNPLNQKRIAIITFQDYDFLKNHIFPEYVGGIVKVTSPLFWKLQIFTRKAITNSH